MNNFISLNIRYLRNSKKLSQLELSEEIGVKRTSVASWEQGISYPNINTLLKLCNYFGLKLDDLITKDLRARSILLKISDKKNNKADSNEVRESIAPYSTMEEIYKHELEMLNKQISNYEKQIEEHKNIIEHYKFIISKIEMEDSPGLGKVNIKEQKNQKDEN
jgi:transcriptional regulator with XRE-family HTH domain